MAKCRNCKRETNRIYAGLCVPCRGIEAERRERIIMEKESALNQYVGVTKITNELYVKMVQEINVWREELHRNRALRRAELEGLEGGLYD